MFSVFLFNQEKNGLWIETRNNAFYELNGGQKTFCTAEKPWF